MSDSRSSKQIFADAVNQAMDLLLEPMINETRDDMRDMGIEESKIEQHITRIRAKVQAKHFSQVRQFVIDQIKKENEKIELKTAPTSIKINRP